MKAFEYLQEFKDDKSKQYSTNTLTSYISDIMQFNDYIKKDFEELNKDDIDSYISYILSSTNKRSEKPIKPQTVNKKLVAIRQFIEWINANTDIKIYVKVELIEIQRQEYLSDNLLNSSDFERIIKATEKAESLQKMQAKALLYGLYYTGLRISELLQMKVSDLNKADIWVKGKGSKYREIPLTDKLKTSLTEYIKIRGLSENDYIFVNLYKNNVMSRQTAHLIIKKYGGLAKIKLKRVHLHNIRHLFCLKLIDKGASIEEVADLAGHSNINITRIYTRKTKDELRKTVDLL